MAQCLLFKYGTWGHARTHMIFFTWLKLCRIRVEFKMRLELGIAL